MCWPTRSLDSYFLQLLLFSDGRYSTLLYSTLLYSTLLYPCQTICRLPLRDNCWLRMQVHLFIDKSLSRLKGSDRTLPQILRLRQMLKRGLAVHHAGAKKLASCMTPCRPVL